MKLLCYCSSLKATSGYILTEMDMMGNLQPCSMTPELSGILQQEGISMAIVYRRNDVFLALKRLRPSQNPPLDCSNSIIYVNLVFIFDQTQKNTMNALALYALEEPQEAADQLCSAYDHRANNTIGYSFDKAKVEKVIEHAVERANQRLNKYSISTSTEPQQVDIQGACRLICARQTNLKDCVFLVNTNLSLEQLKRNGVLPRYYITTSQSRNDHPIQKVRTTRMGRKFQSLFRKNGKLSLKRAAILLGVLTLCIIIPVTITVLRRSPSSAPMSTSTETREIEEQLPLSADVRYDAEVCVGTPIVYEVAGQGGELPYRFSLKIYADNEFVQSFARQDHGGFCAETTQPGVYRAVISVIDNTGSEYETEKFTFVRDDKNTELFSVKRMKNDELCLTGFDRNAFHKRTVLIPSSIEGMKITSIAADAFEQAKEGQHIKLPNSLEHIEDGALTPEQHLVLIYRGDSVEVHEAIRQYEQLFKGKAAASDVDKNP